MTVGPVPMGTGPSPGGQLSGSRSRVAQRLGFRLAALLAVALLPLAIISFLQADAWVAAARDQRAAVLMGDTLRVSSPVIGLIREAQGAAAALARTVRPLLDDERTCDAVMSHLAGVSPQYSFVGYVPSDGRMICASDGAAYDYSGNPLFQEIMADLRAQILVNSRSPVARTSVVLVIHPVIARLGGGYSGYVVLALPHSALPADATLARGDARRELPSFLTMNRDGMVLTSSGGLDHAADLLPQDVPLAERARDGLASFVTRTAAGQERFYALVPVVEGQLYVLGSVPAREAVGLGPVSLVTPFLVSALMWAGSLIVAWIAAERLVSRHIRRLGRAIGAFASGNRVVGGLDMEGAPAEIRDVGQAFLRMTETILRDEAELEDTVHQREVLLREVHHRVKNNLQLIASIMNMQSRRARSPETKALMRGLQERVMSLATVHKELYQTSGLTDVRADELLGDITRQIIGMASAPGRAFHIDHDFAPIPLTPDQAVPLSLLLTEALTNAIKYAEPAPGASSPRLELRFAPLPGNRAELVIVNTASEGEAAAEPEGTGLGQQLVGAFASQLGGELETRQADGRYLLRVAFELNPLARAENRHGA
ncbi:sensor histidine kinase [Rubellimicrobium roseum]|uniref:histidine kinase n=1 Tax=Rubellimicrobium roseum TaxID=687525 RepID=A0A5C4NE87_9RHOB|nr:histidine kinase dimerization/phosphoacceptor domain -containing protein [Rubellimicrobium roseum]TNC72452.1 sensor histidine kinase [Rubellimicrobium roseum]